MLRLPYHCLAIDVPARIAIQTISPEEVLGWDAVDYIASRTAGDAWLEAGRSALLQVPSITGYPFEYNVLINPRHPTVRRLRLGGPYPVVWDDRLLGIPQE